ncbi:MAG: hypothetical protein ACE5GO_09720, partial [Anaerolineales bacterium]
VPAGGDEAAAKGNDHRELQGLPASLPGGFETNEKEPASEKPLTIALSSWFLQCGSLWVQFGDLPAKILKPR